MRPTRPDPARGPDLDRRWPRLLNEDGTTNWIDTDARVRDWRRAMGAALRMHAAWLRGGAGGARLVATGTSLRGPDHHEERAVFRRANLRGANLRGADLRMDLGYADLSGADLRDADLSVADLSCADLRGADLRGARLGRLTERSTRVGFTASGIRDRWAGANVAGAQIAVHYLDHDGDSWAPWDDVLAVAAPTRAIEHEGLW